MRTNLLGVLLVCGISCLSISCTTAGATPWQATVDSVAALHKDLEFPSYLAEDDAAKQGGEFDVNRYFSVLTHLSIQSGYTLDYVYHYDGMGGFPILYARPTDQAPYTSESEFILAMDQAGIAKVREQYLPYLQVEDTAEGYFEYVVFRTLADQFYLYWHADYNDVQIVTDEAALNAVLKQERSGYPIPITASLQARLLNLAPVINLQADTAQVQVVTFSAWKGFVRETWIIDRHAPHAVLSVDTKVLVPYSCGIMF